MKVTAIMATCGRHYFCERSVGMFLNQTHPDKHLVIIQNSDYDQKLDREYDNITIANKSDFSNLGSIYNYALQFVPKDSDVFCLFDDDDIYMPNHIEEGVKGLIRGNKKAYKPQFSYFNNNNEISKTSNVLEPSWFVYYDVINQNRFREESDRHHFNWIEWCIGTDNLYEPVDGVSTLGYTWGDDSGIQVIHHISGANSEKFLQHRKYSQDHGDGIITPMSIDQLEPLYNKIRAFK
jgi:GT2 family glycosyltransferase